MILPESFISGLIDGWLPFLAGLNVILKNSTDEWIRPEID